MSIYNKLRSIQNARTDADNAAIAAAKAATPAHLRRSFEVARPFLTYDAKNGEAFVFVSEASREQRNALVSIGGEIDPNGAGVKFPASRIADIASVIPA